MCDKNVSYAYLTFKQSLITKYVVFFKSVEYKKIKSFYKYYFKFNLISSSFLSILTNF